MPSTVTGGLGNGRACSAADSGVRVAGFFAALAGLEAAPFPAAVPFDRGGFPVLLATRIGPCGTKPAASLRSIVLCAPPHHGGWANIRVRPTERGPWQIPSSTK